MTKSTCSGTQRCPASQEKINKKANNRWATTHFRGTPIISEEVHNKHIKNVNTCDEFEMFWHTAMPNFSRKDQTRNKIGELPLILEETHWFQRTSAKQSKTMQTSVTNSKCSGTQRCPTSQEMSTNVKHRLTGIIYSPIWSIFPIFWFWYFLKLLRYPTDN